jgi:S1-C subfamily serine protease
VRRRLTGLVSLLVLASLLACSPLVQPVQRLGSAANLPPVTPVPTSPPSIYTSATTAAMPTSLPAEVLGGLAAIDQALTNVYARTKDSVEFIAVAKPSSSGTGQASGSCWVWDSQGHLVTNNHVVEGATSIFVRFANDVEVEAKVVGTDADSDLAVVKVDLPGQTLTPLALGDSSRLQVGQTAIAIGNPFGFERTMTSGIVSAIGRVSRQSSGYSLPNLVQTDTPINPGNSGGPLLDVQGRVIGVTTMIYSQTGEFSGIGLAVPVNTVKKVVPALISTGHYRHPYLGISGTSIGPMTASLFQLPVVHGALIEQVVPGGPAERAGIKAGTEEKQIPGFSQPVVLGGDIITAIDGRKIAAMDELITFLEDYSVGDTVQLTVLRGEQSVQVPVVLAERPASSGG